MKLHNILKYVKKLDNSAVGIGYTISRVPSVDKSKVFTYDNVTIYLNKPSFMYFEHEDWWISNIDISKLGIEANIHYKESVNAISVKTGMSLRDDMFFIDNKDSLLEMNYHKTIGFEKPIENIGKTYVCISVSGLGKITKEFLDSLFDNMTSLDNIPDKKSNVLKTIDVSYKFENNSDVLDRCRDISNTIDYWDTLRLTSVEDSWRGFITNANSFRNLHY